MHKTLKVKFKNGEFRPITPISGIDEGETVEIVLKKNTKNSGFVGMWRDRDDIKSGLDYVKRIRSLNRFT